ncbi:hypothetical protein BZL43_23780, partial [Pseudomonas sp. PICF141]
GVSGEHIADYICAVEFGWGKDWDGHDKGADGKWLEGVPSASKTGKLSAGGSPKAKHVLYKLSDGANGTGIDAVWRANPSNNGGEKFAIVEAKASRDEDAPKFMRKLNNMRKPGVGSKLGVSGLGDPSTLLEPIESEQDASSKNSPSTKNTGRSKKLPSKSSKTSTTKSKDVLVQMSVEWILSNLQKAVGNRILAAQVEASYSRHLFYSPLYHPSSSPKEHAEARINNANESEHHIHKAFHYNETEVKAFVNKRKKSLTKKHGALNTLKIEA